MKVLSLFDGIATAYEAFLALGIEITEYVSYEIAPLPRAIALANHPDMICHGDVRECNGNDYKEHILVGGSSCQDLSQAKSNRKGLSGEKSSIFFEYVRIWREMDTPLFLFENVGSMSKEDEEIINSIFKTEPIRINSGKYAPALRNRYYWTNIKKGDLPVADNARYKSWVPKNLQDILEDGYTDREKARALLTSDSRPLSTPVKMVHRYWSSGFTTIIFKSKEHRDSCRELYEKHFYKIVKGKRVPISAREIDEKLKSGLDVSVFDGVRYLTQKELEMCQTVREGYTSMVNRNRSAHALGNGWTQIVIERLLAGERD